MSEGHGGGAPGVRAGPRLGPGERLKSKREFERVRREGRRGGDAVVRVLVARNGLAWPRLASAVPRRYGPAVARNRLRRLYTEAFRMEKGRLPAGVDVVLSPPPGSSEPTLEVLLRQPGKLLSQRYLLSQVWGAAYVNQPANLRLYIAQLRRKLEAQPSRPRHLLTEPGMGYRFQP